MLVEMEECEHEPLTEDLSQAKSGGKAETRVGEFSTDYTFCLERTVRGLFSSDIEGQERKGVEEGSVITDQVQTGVQRRTEEGVSPQIGNQVFKWREKETEQIGSREARADQSGEHLG